jgi:hypothetical protein
MCNSIQLRKSLVTIIGSIHSNESCISALNRVKPTHVLVEATKDTIGLIRRKNQSLTLKDLPSLVRFSDAHSIPIHAIDLPTSMITAKVFDGFSFLKKLAVWKYVLSKRLLAPTAQYLLDRTLEIPRTQADSFIGRWIVSPLLLGEIRKLLADGAGQYEIDKLIRSKQDASSFLSRRDYDPLAYLELCDQTSIDVRLQSTLIEYRNAFMCSEVRGILRSIPDNSVCAVVVGQNHLEGMISNLERGMDFVPESLLSGTSSDDERHSGLIDQFLLALLLDT